MYTKKASQKDHTKKKVYSSEKENRKFISRSVHGSGAFTDEEIDEGYRCEPVMGD